MKAFINWDTRTILTEEGFDALCEREFDNWRTRGELAELVDSYSTVTLEEVIQALYDNEIDSETLQNEVDIAIKNILDYEEVEY